MRGRPNTRWIAAALIVAVLAMLGGLASLRAVALRSAITSDFMSAQAHLERGRALLKQANADHNPTLIDQSVEELQLAKGSFETARSYPELRAASQLSSLPLIGPPAGTVDRLSRMGVDLSLAGIDAAKVDRAFLDTGHTSDPQEQGASKLINLMIQQQAQIDRIRSRLADARAQAAGVDPAVLPASQRAAFAKAKSSIDSGIAGLDEFQRMTPVLQEVLGVNGRRIYVIEQVNQFELRAGGGYVGSYTVISADHGKISVLKSGDTHDLPDYKLPKGQRGYTPPPATMVEFLKDLSWSVADSNFFPSFPDNATAAESFADRDFGTKVDGVIAIDLSAVEAMMQIAGPMSVPGYGLQLSSANLIAETMRVDIAGDPNHKKILAALAGPLMDRLSNLGAQQWPQLLQTMNTLASQRHLQAYFNNGPAEEEMKRFGWAGQSQPDPGHEFMMAVESNFGGNKANYFLNRSYVLSLESKNGALHHHLDVKLHLDLRTAPVNYSPSYRCYFRLYTPANASNLRISNVKSDDYPNTSIPTGMALVDGWQQMNPGRTTRQADLAIGYDWDTPASAADTKIYWQKQPGTAADHVTVQWTTAGHTYKAESDLAQDRVISLTGTGATIAPGVAATAKLPSISL